MPDLSWSEVAGLSRSLDFRIARERELLFQFARTALQVSSSADFSRLTISATSASLMISGGEKAP